MVRTTALTFAILGIAAAADAAENERVIRDQLNAGSPFDYDTRDPAFEYVPFLDIMGASDCWAMEAAGNSTEFVNCGVEFPPPEGSSPSSLTWAFVRFFLYLLPSHHL